ncbi:MAG TPA: ATP-binding protein [Geothrix sp.]|nr:ATP-binding protein [Geothrix sp.]
MTSPFDEAGNSFGKNAGHQQAQYRLFFEQMQEGCALNEIITDENGRVVDFRVLETNAAWERHTGLKPALAVGKTMTEIMPLVDRNQIEQYGSVALTGEPKVFEYFSNTFGRWFRVRAFSPQPRIFATIFEDITERKEAEETLRQERASYMDLVNTLHLGVYRLRTQSLEKQKEEAWQDPADIHDSVELVSEPYCQILGLTKAAIGNNPGYFTDLIHPDDKHGFTKAVRDAMAGPVRFSWEGRLLIGGKIKWVHTESHPRVLDNGDALWTGTLMDITGKIQAEETQTALLAQLAQSQKMESLGTLAGGIAHDMNNVLGAILGLASAHIDTQLYGSPLHQALDKICKATERGGKMVKSLLNFARQSPAENQILDMNAILLEQVGLLERTTLAKVQLRVDLEPNLRPMLGDASALTHAFMNLCVNAVDAMPEQGTLWLRTRNADPGWIEVTVQDTGCGMTRDVLDKALDPFFTTKGHGKGTGLGLSLVYSTVKAHQGRMEIQSQPGQGTCVRMRFPICAPVLQTRETAAELRADTRPLSLSVLIVDDDDLVQCSIQMMLEALGHRTVSAMSGESALTDLEAGIQADVVILDMNMPGLGGAGTLPRLRELRPLVPVLLATGRTDQNALDLIQAHPSTLLLPKPFTLKDLQQSLATLLKT